MKKRIASYLLLVALVLGLFSNVAYADQVIKHSVPIVQGDKAVGTLELNYSAGKLDFELSTKEDWLVKSIIIGYGSETKAFSKNEYTNKLADSLSNVTYDQVKELTVTLDAAPLVSKSDTLEISSGPETLKLASGGASIAYEAPLHSDWMNAMSWHSSANTVIAKYFTNQTVAQVLRFNSTNTGTEKWMWSSASTDGKSTADEIVQFAGNLKLPANATKVNSAVIALAVDNLYTLNIGGSSFSNPGADYRQASAYDITSLLKAGDNAFTLQATNIGQSGTYKSNPAGVVFRAVISYDAPEVGAAAQVKQTITMPAWNATKVELQTKLWARTVNNTVIDAEGAKASAPSVKPGDKVGFTLQLANTGNIAFKPGTVSAAIPDGFVFDAADNAGWTLSGNTASAKYAGSAIVAGKNERMTLVLRVKDSVAMNAKLTVSAQVDTLFDTNGNAAVNSDPAKNKDSADVLANPAADTIDAKVKVWVRSINGTVIDAEGTSASIPEVKAGDVVSYRIQLTNTGTASFKPTGYNGKLNANLDFNSSDNTGWTYANGTLSAAYTKALLKANESDILDLVLRVKSNITQNTVIEQTVSAAGFLNEANAPANNRVSDNSGATAKIKIPAVPDTIIDAKFKMWVYAVNGSVVDSTGASTAAYTPKAGDTVTYRMQITNTGTVAFLPGDFQALLPAQMDFNASDNPGWKNDNGKLSYKYSGAVLGASQFTTRDLLLRVKTGTTVGTAISLTGSMDNYTDANGRTAGNRNAANNSALISLITGSGINTAISSQVRMWIYAINGSVIAENFPSVPQSVAAQPGDVVWYKLQVTNTGNVPFRPAKYTATLHVGMEFDATNAYNLGWVLSGNALSSDYTGGILNWNQSATRDLVLKVRSNLANGTLVQQSAEVAAYADQNGNPCTNANTNQATAQFTVSPNQQVNLKSEMYLAAINGRSVSATTSTVKPGDLLTYRIKITNIGTTIGKPTQFLATLSDTLEFASSENPGWTLTGNLLMSDYTGNALNPNEYITRDVSLRVKNTIGDNASFSFTAEATKFVDGQGYPATNIDANKGKVTLTLRTGYGDIAQTGEGLGNLLPMFLGIGVLLVSGGTWFFLRKKRQAKS